MHGVKKVSVIGAGVSGVSTAAHLKAAGLDVTVYERGSKAGGVWVYDDRIAVEPDYPSVLPSVGDSPAYTAFIRDQSSPQDQDADPVRVKRGDSPMEEDQKQFLQNLPLLHAPPGPCYASLHNNVSTIEMELRANKWKPDTEEFVRHNVLAEYIQDTAKKTDIDPLIKYNTRVDEIKKNGDRWIVHTSTLTKPTTSGDVPRPITSIEEFDAVVVASGHYHACVTPDIPGLSNWKEKWPASVRHSKTYRNPSGFENQNVLLVGSGVSAWDIAREIGPITKTIYQVSRGGPYDLPAALFPPNTVRIGEIAAFDNVDDDAQRAEDGSLPGTVHLKSGHKIRGIHQVILCTGYHMSYPFLSNHHSDTAEPEDADDEVLVTKDGQRTHNLHKDIFYIPDPTLAFIGVPYHVATFSLFEFQGMAVAAVYSGQASLPGETEMRKEYDQKTAEKGAGRAFHSLKGDGNEIEYVNDLLKIVNQDAEAQGRPVVEGHTQAWLESYARRGKRLAQLFQQAPDEPERSLDEILGPVESH